jgi:hypothetical protein
MENFKQTIKSQGEEKRQIKDYEFAFGKYKGKTFEWVYDNDIKYVSWLLETLEEEKNNFLVDYYKNRINVDFSDENLTDTLDKRGLLPSNPPKLERS